MKGMTLMKNFFLEIYFAFLRFIGGSWFEDYVAPASRPMTIGFLFFIIFGFLLLGINWGITPSQKGTIFGTGLAIQFLLAAITGILWLREGKIPFFITGILRGKKTEKIQVFLWIILWGGMGLLMLFFTFIKQ